MPGLLEGVPMILMAVFMTGLITATQPAENILIPRYTPQNRVGRILGLNFVIILGGFAELG